MPDENGEKVKKKSQNKKVLTLRVEPELYDDIESITARMNSNKSRVCENFLNLSEIMMVKEDFTKIGWDNYPLSIYPENLVLEIFGLMNSGINNDNRYGIYLNLGDKMGSYLNDLYNLKGIADDNFRGMFDIIKKLGWFSYSGKELGENKEILLIPKNFGAKPLIYAMVYRMIVKTRFPPEWNYNMLERNIPYNIPDPDKKQRKENDEFRSRYDTYVYNILEPDLTSERRTNFYHFRKLTVHKV